MTLLLVTGTRMDDLICLSSKRAIPAPRALKFILSHPNYRIVGKLNMARKQLIPMDFICLSSDYGHQILIFAFRSYKLGLFRQV